jgi:hypothetical protein
MSRVLILIIVLTLSSAGIAMVDLPAGCWQSQKVPCAVRASHAGEAFTYHQAGGQAMEFELVAEKKASWVVQVDGIKLIQGEFWVKSSKDLIILSNSISAQVNGEFWIDVKEDITEIKNLQAEFKKLQMTGSVQGEEDVTLPVGFENWYGTLNSEGKLNMGVLRPIDRAPFFSTWARHMKISKAVAVAQIEKWKEIWTGAVAASSELYARVIERKIANEEAKRRELQRRIDEEAAEKRQLRQMFRVRHSLGEP